jgi:hypothetical protein
MVLMLVGAFLALRPAAAKAAQPVKSLQSPAK